VFGIGAFTLETRDVQWTLQFQLALGWLVFGLSVSAILILMWLIRRGAASQVASLFYLVPPVTALEAFLLFDERLGPVAILGGLVAITGVGLVTARPKTARAA
jgi:drug/metabolite transporter (DMT)-like permease